MGCFDNQILFSRTLASTWGLIPQSNYLWCSPVGTSLLNIFNHVILMVLNFFDKQSL